MKRKLAVVALVPVVALGLVGCSNSEPIESQPAPVVVNEDAPDCDNDDAARWEEGDCGYYDSSGFWVWHSYVTPQTRAYAKGLPPKGVHKVHASQGGYNPKATSPAKPAPPASKSTPQKPSSSIWDKLSGKGKCQFMAKPGGGSGFSSGGGSSSSRSSSGGSSNSYKGGSSSGYKGGKSAPGC